MNSEEISSLVIFSIALNMFPFFIYNSTLLPALANVQHLFEPLSVDLLKMVCNILIFGHAILQCYCLQRGIRKVEMVYLKMWQLLSTAELVAVSVISTVLFNLEYFNEKETITLILLPSFCFLDIVGHFVLVSCTWDHISSQCQTPAVRERGVNVARTAENIQQDQGKTNCNTA